MAFKKSRKYKSFFSTKFGKLVAVLIFAALVFPVVKVYLKSRQANQMNDGVEQELVEMQAKREFLMAEIARLKTEGGKEEEARKKLNIAKPDEEMIIITDKSKGEENGDGVDQNLWQKIKNIF